VARGAPRDSARVAEAHAKTEGWITRRDWAADLATAHRAPVPLRPIATAGRQTPEDGLLPTVDFIANSGFVSPNRVLTRVFRLYSHSGCRGTKQSQLPPGDRWGAQACVRTPTFAMAIPTRAAACDAGRKRRAGGARRTTADRGRARPMDSGSE